MNQNMPSLESIESRHSFPGAYMFKVIGSADDGFVGRAVVAVRKGLGIEIDPRFEMRQTSGGRHVALTFDPVVESAADVLAVYENLVKLDGVVLVL